MTQHIDTLRHELKFHISMGAHALLSRQCASLLWRDDNADENGDYFIRSLYFDDPYNTALNDKLDGVRYRDKYRIRVYNLSDKMIRLERKEKHGAFIHKEAVTISSTVCDQLMAGDASGLERADAPLLRDMFRMVTTRLLRPVIYVDYLREAYVHPAENVRITFDKHIRTGAPTFGMFERRVPTLPVLDNETVVMEIKYDNRLPAYLTPLLSQVAATPSAISKYVLCRRFR